MCQVQGLRPASYSRGQFVTENTQQPCRPRANHEIFHYFLPELTCAVVSAESIPVYSRGCFQFVKGASKIRHCVRARNPSTSPRATSPCKGNCKAFTSCRQHRPGSTA